MPSVGFMSCKDLGLAALRSVAVIKNQEQKYHHLCSVEESFLTREHHVFFFFGEGGGGGILILHFTCNVNLYFRHTKSGKCCKYNVNI